MTRAAERRPAANGTPSEITADQATDRPESSAPARHRRGPEHLVYRGPRLTAEQRSARSSIAARLRHRPTDPGLVEDRRAYLAARLEGIVRGFLSAEPGLDRAQRCRVAALLLDDQLVTADRNGGGRCRDDSSAR